MMNYDQYVKYQTEGPGMIKKPLKYRRGERRAIEWFFELVPRHLSVFDLGCGTAVGIKHLEKLGFTKISGIELNQKKVNICRRKVNNSKIYFGDITSTSIWGKYDVIWASHSFEHMLEPEKVIRILHRITYPMAQFFFILPYPDTGPKEVHCASDIIGTRIDDAGKTVMNWFENNGLRIVDYKFDNFRENEIWLKMIKDL